MPKSRLFLLLFLANDRLQAAVQYFWLRLAAKTSPHHLHARSATVSIRPLNMPLSCHHSDGMSTGQVSRAAAPESPCSPSPNGSGKASGGYDIFAGLWVGLAVFGRSQGTSIAVARNRVFAFPGSDSDGIAPSSRAGLDWFSRVDRRTSRTKQGTKPFRKSRS